MSQTSPPSASAGPGAEPSRAPIVYALTEDGARRRARATALWQAFATLLPPGMTLILVGQLGFVPRGLALLLGALILGLAATRAVFGYRLVRRRLRSFVLTLDGADLRLTTVRASVQVPRARVRRVLDVGGPLGGLRLELAPDPRQPDLPSRLDVPRGGLEFGELRAAFARDAPFARASRRGPTARLLLGAFVVLSIFFVPFVVEDVVARSRLAMCLVVLAVWGTVRAVLARS